MRLIALHGSPDSKGFSSTLHREFLTPFREKGVQISEYFTYSMNIHPCTACSGCRDEFKCIYDDDMTEIYPLITETDFITISAPLYFSSFPSPLKAFIDRCQVLWELKERRGDNIKRGHGFLIAAGGSVYSNMFTGVLLTVKHFFNSISVNYSADDSILYSGTDSLDEISLEIKDKARYTGEEFIKKYPLL